jgi:hypothetical protein
MSAEQTLFEKYREWRRLTVAAGRAIQRRNWDFLGECQELIQKLQSQVTQLTREARDEWAKSGTDLAAKEAELRVVVSGLIELGRRNQERLQAARQAAQAERGRLERAGQNLRLLQQSYAFARPAGWTSFS